MINDEVDDHIAGFVESSPKLLELAASIELEEEILPTAVAVCRRLLGLPPEGQTTLSRLLFAVADEELRVLKAASKGEIMHAAVGGLTWLEQILRNLGAREKESARLGVEVRELVDDEFDIDHDLYRHEPAGLQHNPPQESEESAKLHDAALRTQLAALIQRELPAGFPLPAVSDDEHLSDPVSAGATLSHELGVSEAGEIALDHTLTIDPVLSSLGQLLPGFGWDYSLGTLKQTLLHDIARLGRLLERLPCLQQIAEELGRMEAEERTHRRAAGGGRESVVGVRVGGELADVLPCELALLSSPETEDLFFQRYSEHRLLCLELRGTVTETTTSTAARGPAIACIDTSGSMQGSPEVIAKALILAVTRQLVPQRRSLELLLFGGPGQSHELELRGGRGGLGMSQDSCRVRFMRSA